MTDLIYRPPTRRLNFTVNVFRTVEDIRRSRDAYDKHLKDIEVKVIRKRIEDVKRLRVLAGRKKMKKDPNVKRIKENLIAEIRDQARRHQITQELDLGNSNGDDTDPDWAQDNQAVSKHGELAKAKYDWDSEAAETARRNQLDAAHTQYINSRTPCYNALAELNKAVNVLEGLNKQIADLRAQWAAIMTVLEPTIAEYERRRQIHHLMPAGNEREVERAELNRLHSIYQPKVDLANGYLNQIPPIEAQIPAAQQDVDNKRQIYEPLQVQFSDAEKAYRKVEAEVARDREQKQALYEALKLEYETIIKADYVNYRNDISSFSIERGAEYSEDRKELEVKFPDEFVRSQNRRYVNVISVRAVQMRREYNGPILGTLLLTPREQTSAYRKMAHMKNLRQDTKDKVLTAASHDDGEGILDALVPTRDKTKPYPNLSDTNPLIYTFNGNDRTKVLNRGQTRHVTLKEWEEYLPDIYTLHCTFVHDQYNDDYTVAFLNEPLTVPRKYEQYQNQPSFRLWVADSTDNSPESFANRIDLEHPVKSFLKQQFKFKELQKDVYDSLCRLYSYVLIIQMELEF